MDAASRRRARLRQGRNARTSFAYEAITDKSRRQAPKTKTVHESVELTSKKRQKLLGTAQDQVRNQSLVAWMVRKHLDYVSSFHISFRTKDESLNKLVNRIFHWHGAPKNIDYGGRFGRDEMFRLFELEKVTCGDAALIKLGDLKMQTLESDMIAKGKSPDGTPIPEEINSHGLVIEGGAVTKYAVCNRGDAGKSVVYDHLEPAENVIFDAYWTRFGSQFRGVSPLSTAINTVQDLHEAFEFNLIKTKMHALFGVAVMRDSGGTDGGFGGAAGALDETSGGTTTETDTDTHLDLNPRAVNLLDLNQNDSVETFESKSPSTEFVNGAYLFINLAMLALDIPATAFDSRRSSFSARIADLNEYEVSVASKRTKNRYVRQQYSDWVLETIWNDPASPWPLRDVAQRAGMSLREVQEMVEWIPAGSPWLDKKKQVEGDDLAIEIRVDNPIDAARRRGSDVFKNIDKTLQVEKYEQEQRAEMDLPAREPATSGEKETDTDEA